MMPKLLINKTIFAGIALALVIFMVMVVVSYRQTKQANLTAISIAHSEEILYQTTLVLSTITDNETGSRGFILTGKNEFLEPLEKSKKNIHQQIAALREINKDNAGRYPLIDSLLFYTDARIRFSDSTVAVRKKDGLTAAIQLVSTGRGKLYVDNIRSIIDQVQADENILLQKKKKAIASQLKTEQYIFIVIALFVLGLLAILFWKEREKKKQKERKKIREQLASLSQQINQSNDAIYTLDATRKIKSWNRGAESLYGFTREEAMGNDPNELLKTDVTSEEMIIALIEIDENDYWTGELKRETKNGEVIYVRASTTNIKDTNGNIKGYVAVSFNITRQKKLAEQVSHLASIVEQSSEAIFSIDTDQRIISWNRGAESLFGISPEEAIGKTATGLDFIHLTTDEIQAVEKQVAETGSWKSERNFFHTDGYSFYGAVTGNLVRNEEGEIISFNFIVKDISLRKQLEEQLKKTNADLEQKVIERTQEIYQSEKKYRYLFENNPLPMWIIDATTFTFLDVNEMAIRHYGYSRGEFLSMTALDIRPEESKEDFLQIDRSSPYNESINNRGIWNHVKKDGTLVQVEINAHYINFENKKATLVLANDVTEKIKADKKLTASEKRFQAMIENNSDLINVVDGDYKILYRSPSAFRITGFTDEEILRQEGYVNIHPQDREPTMNMFKEVLANPGKPIYSLYRNLHKNGQYIWLEGVVTNLLHDENVRGFVANYRDVTERKKLEDLLNQANLLANTGGWEIDLLKETIYWTDITRKIHETDDHYVPDLQGGINFYKEGKGRDLITKKVKEAIETGKPWDEELQIVTAKNNECWIRTIGEAEFADGKCIRIYGSFQDIDQRKKAEEKLIESEKRFRALVENNDGIISLIDENLITTFRSSSAARITGWTNAELEKVDTKNYIHPRDIETMQKIMATALANPGKDFPVSLRVKHKNGHYIWLEGVINNKIQDPAVRGVITNLRDVTERVEAAQKIIKGNRLYFFISQINQMIVRTSDEQTLFKEVCAIAVNPGKFRMAWIGMIDEKTRKVLPVMYAGEENGYLSKIKSISIDNTPEGNGPTGTAVREDRYAVCNDIETDPTMAMWKELALSRGYFSSMSLPIKKFGKVVGAFTVYASEKNFFDAAEIALLEEATGDVAFALELFEKEILRKKAEEAVTESEQRYHTLTEVAPVGIFHTDANGATTYVNPNWCKIACLSFEEALGNGWLTAVHADDKEKLIKSWQKATAGMEISLSEYRFVRPDGTIAWVIGQAIPERNTDNQVIGYVGTITDITRNKTAENLIIKEKQLSETIINNLPGIFYLYDDMGNFMRWNNNFENVSGYNSDEIARMRPVDFYDEDQQERIKARIKAVLDKNSPGIEVEIFTKNKNKIPYYINSIAIEYEGKRCILGMGLDLSERKKAEEEIKKANERYELIGKATNDGVWDWNLKTGKLWSNDMHQKLYGLTTPDPVPDFEEFKKRLHPKDRERVVSAMEEAASSSNNSYSEEYRFFTESNGWINIYGRTFIERDKQGKAIRLIGSMMDITERKQAEEKIKAANERFEMIAQATNDAVFDLDLITGESWHNETFLHLFSDDKGGKNITPTREQWQAKLHPEDRDRVIKKLTTAYEGSSDIWIDEFRFQREDGSYGIFYDRGYISRDAAGKALRIIGSMTDITELKKIEEQLNESEEKYRSLIEQASDAIFINDEDNNLLNVNESACAMLGYTKTQLCSMKVEDLYTAEELAVRPTIRHELLRGRRTSMERFMLRQDGTSVPVEITAKMLKDGRVVAIVRDVSERKKAEEKLKEQNAQLETLSNNLPGAMIYQVVRQLDGSMNFTYVSKGIISLTGKTPEEVIKDQSILYNLVIEEDRPKMLSAENKSFLNMSVFNEEIRCRDYQHKIHWLNIISTPRKMEDGRIVWDGFHVDITERKKVEEEIKSSEEKRRMIMNAALDAIICIDTKGFITFWNPMAKQIFGWQEQEVMGRLLSEIIIPEPFRKMHDQGMKNYLITGKGPALNVLLELKAINRQGNEFPIELTVLPIKQGGEEFFCAFVRNITDRKRAQEDILLSNERYNLVSKATNDSIWDLNISSGIINRTGDGFKNLFGYNNDHESNNSSLHWTKLIHPEDLLRIQESQRAVFNNPGEFYWEEEYRMQKANGDYAAVYDKGYIIRDENGQAVRMIGATQDITRLKENEMHLKKLNESLLQQAKELADSNAELEQFAYVASHDLQEPLRMVTGFLSLLEKNYGAVIDSNGKKYIHYAVDGAMRMKQIILDILEFSKIGRLDGVKQQVDLQHLVTDIEQLYSKQVEEQMAVIDTGKLPVVIADEAPLRQVFQNLISNALKYTRVNMPSHITITATEQNDHWLFAVKDNGIGIEKEYFNRIFVIFQRLHNQNEFSGTGIGLAITKKIIENLGGKIWLESEPGEGTTFYFTIKK